MKTLKWIFLIFLNFSLVPLVVAVDTTPQSLLNALKAHQDQVSSIEANLQMSIFGVGGQTITQSGSYHYSAPDQVTMSLTDPAPQEVRINGNDVKVSLNGGPFQTVPLREASAGMNSDLFYYHFLNQFWLERDHSEKQAGNLIKVKGYYKNKEGQKADSSTARNPLAVEFLYDPDQKLVTKINFVAVESMPAMELKLGYETINQVAVPKKIFARIITPGGTISSAVVLSDLKVVKQ